VTVFTWDNAMEILGPDIHHITMTFATILMHFLLSRITVLERLVFPDGLIVLVVEAVHEAVFARAKIVRNIKKPEQQNHGDNANDHEQWSPNMTFHCFLPLFPEKDLDPETVRKHFQSTRRLSAVRSVTRGCFIQFPDIGFIMPGET
jgi:hypothetical protein